MLLCSSSSLRATAGFLGAQHEARIVTLPITAGGMRCPCIVELMFCRTSWHTFWKTRVMVIQLHLSSAHACAPVHVCSPHCMCGAWRRVWAWNDLSQRMLCTQQQRW